MTNFKYALLRLMRNKANLFWILVFPILLGCLFKIAFSNITASENFHTIPVAVVEGDNADAAAFHTMIEQLSGDSDDAMLTATFCDDGKARTLLEKGEVDGVFYSTDEIKLAINADRSDASINQSILQSLLTQYYLNRDLIVQMLADNPANIEAFVSSLGQSVDTRKEVSLTNKDTDTYDQYFYNLIAMACLYTAMGGIHLAINNSPNLSTLAARKTIAPAKRRTFLFTELAANIVFESILNIAEFLYHRCLKSPYDGAPWTCTAYDPGIHHVFHHVRYVLRLHRPQIRRRQDRTHVCNRNADVLLKRIDDGKHARRCRKTCSDHKPDQSGCFDFRQLLHAQQLRLDEPLCTGYSHSAFDDSHPVHSLNTRHKEENLCKSVKPLPKSQRRNFQIRLPILLCFSFF